MSTWLRKRRLPKNKVFKHAAPATELPDGLAYKGCVFGPTYERLPGEEVRFGDRAFAK